MAIFRINDVNINVVEMNKTATETIVMIHGMFTNMAVFYFKIAPKLAEKYRVVLYDMKGHGLSDIAPSGYDFHSMSDDLLELMNALELSKVHLVGYSYGGLVALYTAMHCPERVGEIAIIESPNPNDDEPRKLLEKYSRESLEQYTRKLSESTHMKPSSRHLDKLHKIQQYLLDNTTIVNDITQNGIFFQAIASAHLPNKTLLLYANGSECKEAGEFLHRHVKDSRLFFGEGDHNLPVQDPDWVAEKLYDFYTTVK